MKITLGIVMFNVDSDENFPISLLSDAQFPIPIVSDHPISEASEVVQNSGHPSTMLRWFLPFFKHRTSWKILLMAMHSNKKYICKHIR